MKLRRYPVMLAVLLVLPWLLQPLQSGAGENIPLALQPQRPNESWLLRHEEKLREIQARKDTIELVLIGDSISHPFDNWAAARWKKTFPDLPTLNLGFGGDKTENVLWRVQHGELEGLSPRLVILQIGTNNTGHRQDPAQVTAQGIKLIIKEVRQQLPDSRILLLSIFPRGVTADDPLRKLNDAVNWLLPALADNQQVFHLDINARFLDQQGNLADGFTTDLLHLNGKGIEIWLDAMQPVVQRLLNDYPDLRRIDVAK